MHAQLENTYLSGPYSYFQSTDGQIQGSHRLKVLISFDNYHIPEKSVISEISVTKRHLFFKLVK